MNPKAPLFGFFATVDHSPMEDSFHTKVMACTRFCLVRGWTIIAFGGET